MICKVCGRKFLTPLYLFNGQTTCPHCKTELLEVSKLEITKQNEELYALSQIAFFRYLSPRSVDDNKAAKPTVSSAKLYESAFEYCQKAAEQGHPKAISQMAYMLEHFQSQSKNQLERIRNAFEFYAALCYCDLETVKCEDGVPEFTAQDFLKLKTDAGRNLLKLCKVYAIILKSSIRYDYQTNKERLSKKYANEYFLEDEVGANEYNKVLSAFDILASSRSKSRAPLFGIFFLSASQAKELFLLEGDKEHISCKKLIDKSPDFLRCRICNANRSALNANDTQFQRLASADRLNGVLEKLKDDQYLTLFFFNTLGRHQYLNGNQMKQIRKAFGEDDQALLIELVKVISEDVAVFYDDDIVQYKKGNHFSGAIESLINSVRGER